MKITSIIVAFAWLGMGLGGAEVEAAELGLIIDPMFGSTEDTGSSASITMSFMERGKDDVLSITIENTTPAA